MATSSITSPVTRETGAWVRDRGMRPLIVTVTGGIITMRAKGLRSRETLELSWCYQQAVKQRVAQERAEKRAARGARRGGR